VLGDDQADRPTPFAGELGLDRVAFTVDLVNAVWEVVGGVATTIDLPFADPGAVWSPGGEEKADLIHGSPVGKAGDIRLEIVKTGPCQSQAPSGEPKPRPLGHQEAAVFDAALSIEVLDQLQGMLEVNATETRQLIDGNGHLLCEQPQSALSLTWKAVSRIGKGSRRLGIVLGDCVSRLGVHGRLDARLRANLKSPHALGQAAIGFRAQAGD
jgi:hypothetical protein